MHIRCLVAPYSHGTGANNGDVELHPAQAYNIVVSMKYISTENLHHTFSLRCQLAHIHINGNGIRQLQKLRPCFQHDAPINCCGLSRTEGTAVSPIPQKFSTQMQAWSTEIPPPNQPRKWQRPSDSLGLPHVDAGGSENGVWLVQHGRKLGSKVLNVGSCWHRS